MQSVIRRTAKTNQTARKQSCVPGTFRIPPWLSTECPAKTLRVQRTDIAAFYESTNQYIKKNKKKNRRFLSMKARKFSYQNANS